MNIEDIRKYYSSAGVEAIVVIENLNMNFSEGNAFKYLYRCNSLLPKGEIIGDLKKARYYLNRLINKPSNTTGIWCNKYVSMIREDIFSPNIYSALCEIMAAVGVPNANYMISINNAIEHVEHEITRH